MPGLSKYDTKAKRAQRRRNHVARDLATDKYHQRVVLDKRDKFNQHIVDWAFLEEEA